MPATVVAGKHEGMELLRVTTRWWKNNIKEESERNRVYGCSRAAVGASYHTWGQGRQNVAEVLRGSTPVSMLKVMPAAILPCAQYSGSSTGAGGTSQSYARIIQLFTAPRQLVLLAA
jgi:hypothetical protein